MAPSENPTDRAEALLRERVRRLFREFPGALAGDEEPVHQVRVAGRRLRVALPLLAHKAGGRRVKRARRILGDLTRAAGTTSIVPGSGGGFIQARPVERHGWPRRPEGMRGAGAGGTSN